MQFFPPLSKVGLRIAALSIIMFHFQTSKEETREVASSCPLRKLYKQVLHVCWQIMTRTGHSGQYLEYFSEAGPSVSTSDRFLLLSFRMKEVILLSVLRVRELFLSSVEPPVTKGSNEGSRRFHNHGESPY